MEVLEIPMRQVRPNPGQHRKHFDQAELQDLAASIKAVGLQCPILLRPLGDEERDNGHRYEIIAGERRWRAHGILRRRKIRALVNGELRPHQAKAIELLENVQRAEVSPVEEGQGYSDFVRELVKGHHASRQKALDTCARHIGKGLPVVKSRIRLAALPEKYREAVERHHRRKPGGLRVTDADSLARLLFEDAEDVFSLLEGEVLTERQAHLERLGLKALAGRLTGKALASACQAVTEQAVLDLQLAEAQSPETLDASRKVAEAVADAARAVNRLGDVDESMLTHQTLRRNLGRLGAVRIAIVAVEKRLRERDAELTAAKA